MKASVGACLWGAGLHLLRGQTSQFLLAGDGGRAKSELLGLADGLAVAGNAGLGLARLRHKEGRGLFSGFSPPPTHLAMFPLPVLSGARGWNCLEQFPNIRHLQATHLPRTC